jgi:hypothetical protein
MEDGMTQVSTFDSPLLYDKIAQELNTKLSSLAFINDLYGVASVGFESDETFPEIYQNDGTKHNLRIMPDSNRSLSFFIVTGDMVDQDLSFEIPMALIVWFHLTVVDDTKDYDFTAEKIRDVYNVLDKYGCYDISVNINDPFEGFTILEKAKSDNIMRPYTAFRCSFNKTENICLQ